MDDNKLENFLKTYSDAGVPSYVELILGLPEETKESFWSLYTKLDDTVVSQTSEDATNG